MLVELLRQKHYAGFDYEVYYYRDGGSEVDFVVKGETNVAIQVSYELEGLRDRELRALEGFSSRFPQFKLLLITWDSYGEEELRNGRKVKLVPLWKFLLLPRDYLVGGKGSQNSS